LNDASEIKQPFSASVIITVEILFSLNHEAAQVASSILFI